MNPSKSVLSPEQTAARLDDSGFVHLRGSLYAEFSTGDFRSAARLVAEVGDAAEAMNHHPDIQLGYGSVSFQLSSHDAGGVTERDLQLAEQIAELATAAGARVQPGTPAEYEMAIDCMDAEVIRDFWRVGLGYEEREDGDGDVVLVDPRGTGPTVWFQQMGVPRTDRNRIHVDVYVPTAEAQDRVAAILAAGGTLMTDEHAPGWWVLADVDGNELCVCTSEN